jgi:hypothetical protein
LEPIMGWPHQRPEAPRLGRRWRLVVQEHVECLDGLSQVAGLKEREAEVSRRPGIAGFNAKALP